jgi:hypothetical protein
MERAGEVIECLFNRDYGYRYTVRIEYQEKWQDEVCDEARLCSVSERLNFLLTRGINPGESSGGSLSDTTDARTGQ